MSRLRVLVTNMFMVGFSGTEMAAYDVAIGLARRGHAVCLFALDLSPRIRDRLAAGGVESSDDVLALPWVPDVVHGQHNLPIALAAMRFPGAPTVALTHDPLFWADEPLTIASIRGHIAVDALRRQRLLAAGVPEDMITVLHNAVDLARFAPRSDLPARPARAIALVKPGGESAAMIAAACAAEGLPLDLFGPGVAREVGDLEQRLGDYDVAFATGRCAMEAIAVGLATVVCDWRGVAGIACTANWERMRSGNFGAPVLTQPLSVAGLRAEIARYDPAETRRLRVLARAELSLEPYLDRLEILYRVAIERGGGAGGADRTVTEGELLRFLQGSLKRIWQLEQERTALHRQRAALEAHWHERTGSRSWLARQLGALVVRKIRRGAARRG